MNHPDISSIKYFQSQLRELEKKVELERVEYEELMLELSLNKRHEKDKLSREQQININSSQVPLYTPASSVFSGQITSYNSQSSTPVPSTAAGLYNNNLRDDIDEVRPGLALTNCPRPGSRQLRGN